MFILDVGIDPNPNQGGDFDPNPNQGGNGIGGGDPARLRRIQMHQRDTADEIADFWHGTGGTAGEIGFASYSTYTVARVATVGTTTTGSKVVPGLGLVVSGLDVAADCRRVANTPTASDSMEVSLRHYMETGVLTQQQVDRLRTMADSPDFNKDTFKNLLLEMGIPSESRTIPNPAGGPPQQILGADALADQAQANRRTIEVNTHNRNVNIAATVVGVVVGLAIVGAVCWWNPVGWAALSVAAAIVTAVAIVSVCVAVSQVVGRFFRW